MSDVDDIGQKIKGKAQQLKGDFNQERGQNIKGGVQKLKGKVNETIADAKLNAKHPKENRGTKDW